MLLYMQTDKTVFIYMSSGYSKNGKVLCLNKVHYGLERSPMLWQQKLINELKKLDFQEIL